jgi:hypothetical protein
MLRRLADTTLRTYAHELLHFLRWWEGVHHTGMPVVPLKVAALRATPLYDAFFRLTTSALDGVSAWSSLMRTGISL